MSKTAQNPWSAGDAAEKAVAESEALEAKAKAFEADGHDEDDNPLARLFGGGRRNRGPKSTEAERVGKLEELATRYALPASKRFKVGDIVTPTKGLTMRGAGEPHLIVEIVDAGPRGAAIDKAVLAGSNDVHAGSNAFGQRMDFRVLAPGGEGTHVGMWWVESWLLEPWAPKTKAS